MQELILKKSIYNFEAVKEALKAFSDLAKIDLKEEGDNIIVQFNKIETEYKDIVSDEFANYVLGVMG